MNKKLLLVFIATLLFWGWYLTTQTQDELSESIKGVPMEDAVQSTTTTTASTDDETDSGIAMPTRNLDTSITYDAAIKLGDKAEGKEVIWNGQIAYGLSQIDGIKFWIVDSSHPTTIKREGYEWFWAIDSDTWVLPESAHGRWATYLITKFVGEAPCEDKCIYQVRGKVVSLDCTFYDESLYGKQVCMPNVEIESIKKM